MSDVGVVINLDDQQVQDSKAVLDYTNRDFVAIRAQLVGLAKGLMPEWETAGEAPDFGTLLLEIFAYMGDVMHFYIDRTASEAFLGTAVRRQSILYIADMLGYSPVGQQAASVLLHFSLQANDENDPEAIKPILIPKGTRVYNSSGNADNVVVFEMSTAVSLNPGDTEIVGYADEGISVESVNMGTTQGIPNTEFMIQDQGVIYGTVQCYTQEGAITVPWTYVTHLSDARPTQAVFTTFADESGYTHVVFGDNSAGRIPPVNAMLFVSYRYGVGAAANDLSANTVDTIAPITDVDPYGLTLTNPESPLGGSDPESVESMRFSISRGGSRIKNRAVTLNDFADLAMQVPGVAKSVSYGTVYTAVHVRIAPPEGEGNIDYMARLCNSVQAYLYDKVLIGSSVYVEPIDITTLWQDVYLRVLVHVQDAYNRTAVRLQVESVVRSLLKFNNVDFGTRISIGLVYRAMLAVQGVEWAELQWLSTEPPPNEHAFPIARYDSSNNITQQTVTTLLLNSEWSLDVEIVMADPGLGDMRLNSTTAPTLIAISKTDDSGTNNAAVMGAVVAGDHIVVSQVLAPQRWISMVVTAAPTNNANWIQFPVVKVATSTTAPDTNEIVEVSFIRYLPNPATPTGDVNDIATNELLIPRIEPTEVEEPEAEYLGFSEDERTHDGLWVKAVGGAANT